MKEYSFVTNNEKETEKVGALIAPYLTSNSVITLTGDLGAGKTTLTKGLASGLNIKERVISPTFNILKCYFKADIPLYHIDAYRLEDNDADIGLLEYIDGDGIAVIEWPVFIKELIPCSFLEINITILDLNRRQILVKAIGTKYEKIIEIIKEHF
ncbi:MAG TPA: tRNA (adenosine(37)-N6)-threonylcarbamoyltransferase complex ATPase subunit type 1 TsaE [Bacilli bacterium]|nr:tRNA (adenosine(37)-N6)-threonylcarbamoyltransferase complex ATPase subunit type 1 TsaE [Bacilli bacterium]HPK86188.1 tRNA (adenosine(37)-N6)-threonylcarbamoyltransferase complex ATPase subunit type 1 TsaE [Bacilli bacterium]